MGALADQLMLTPARDSHLACLSHVLAHDTRPFTPRSARPGCARGAGYWHKSAIQLRVRVGGIRGYGKVRRGDLHASRSPPRISSDMPDWPTMAHGPWPSMMIVKQNIDCDRAARAVHRSPRRPGSDPHPPISLWRSGDQAIMDARMIGSLRP
ncbi:unnamed protein product [Cutaneotrichosporon oleaginosum]